MGKAYLILKQKSWKTVSPKFELLLCNIGGESDAGSEKSGPQDWARARGWSEIGTKEAHQM